MELFVMYCRNVIFIKKYLKDIQKQISNMDKFFHLSVNIF